MFKLRLSRLKMPLSFRIILLAHSHDRRNHSTRGGIINYPSDTDSRRCGLLQHGHLLGFTIITLALLTPA